MRTKNYTGTSFAALARAYLKSLDLYREAKSAVEVARRIGRDARDLEDHAAELQNRHQAAVVELVSAAVRMREQGGSVSGADTTRLPAAEARYIAAVRSYEAMPSGAEHGLENAQARCKARAGIKAAEREVVNELWSAGELAQVIDLGRYVQSYLLALTAESVAPAL